MPSALARGAAVAAQGGGRPGMMLPPPGMMPPGMPRSPHQAEHVKYMAETEVTAMRPRFGAYATTRAQEETFLENREPEVVQSMRSPSRLGHNRLRRLAEALRWQLDGVESELEEAQQQLMHAKAQLDAVEVEWRSVLESSKKGRNKRAEPMLRELPPYHPAHSATSP